MSSLLVVRNLGKDYPLARGVYPVFHGLDFEVGRGEFTGIMGVSGVGKSTLLNLLGAVDRPTEGQVILEGEDVFALPARERALLRNRKIGFVFQFFHLLPEFTALENVCFPVLIGGSSWPEARARARRALEDALVADKADMRPSQLSGGGQQRVAIARALVNEPRLLLADEPTGNLDWQTGEKIIGLLIDLHARRGLTSIIVTHNEKVAAFCHRLFLMEAGGLKPIPRS
ncbi:MAG: ABC transporter ATP-binding protein [Candidatus Aminicenantes bacterium RBG_13_62_12]|nr:MAG: ABC transporter ATP-binding protein [Candidatus Aminicenantes bacterium RBG_13_62_12]